MFISIKCMVRNTHYHASSMFKLFDRYRCYITHFVYFIIASYCDYARPFTNKFIWIRFQDVAGSMVINMSISTYRCGTVYTGCYTGQYPLTTYTTATNNACFYYNSLTQCESCNIMSVTSCGIFYVFALVTPSSCNFRYFTY